MAAAGQERKELVAELKAAVQGIVDVAIHSHDHEGGGVAALSGTADATGEAEAVSESRSLTEQNASVRRLLKAIEDVLHHQIKPPLFGHVPKAWKYLENLDQCLPGTAGTLQSVRQYGDSDYARVRLFIRLALNEHALSEYLSALAWNKPLTTSFYKDEALLRDEESLDTMFLLLEGLNRFNFALVLKDKELERPRYWDFVPVHGPPSPVAQQLPQQAEATKREGSLVESGGGLKALTSTIVSVVADVAGGGSEAYPAAVAPKRSKARKGRTHRRRSIALPSPPSLPRAADEGEGNGAGDRNGAGRAYAESEAKNEEEKNEAARREGHEEESSSEEEEHVIEEDGERGDASDDEARVVVVTNSQQHTTNTKEEQQHEPDIGRSSDADLDTHISDAPESSGQPPAEEDELEARLRQAQERLRLLRLELSQAQADASQVMDHADRPNEGKDDKPAEPVTTIAPEEKPKESPMPAATTTMATVPIPAMPTERKPSAGAANNRAGARGKKPAKRIVSIMEAGMDERQYEKEKLSRQLQRLHAERAELQASAAQPPDDSRAIADAPETNSLAETSSNSDNIEEREELCEEVLKSLEDFSHQLLTEAAAEGPPQPASPSPSPSPSSAPSSLLAAALSASMPAGDDRAGKASFDKAALSSLRALGPLPSDAIEHHHEFYPAGLDSTGSGLHYYSRSLAPAPRSPLAAALAAGRSPGAAPGGHLVEERTEADLRAEQAQDPSGFLLTVHERIPASRANTRCPSCGVALAEASLLGGIRHCHYSGLYYCPRCHRNEKALIPAAIVHKWDMKERKVSTWAKEHIEAHLTRPTLNIASINPRLYFGEPLLEQALELRKTLAVIGEFVLTCKDRARLVQPLVQAQREYLIESAHRYSLRDLVDLTRNRFLPLLHKLIDEYTEHITKECAVCRGKAHFCELCQDDDHLVFPFQQPSPARCDECKAFYHKACWEREVVGHGRPCPKCERVRAMRERRQREEQREQELLREASNGGQGTTATIARKASAPVQGGRGGRQQLTTSAGGGRQLTYITSHEARREAAKLSESGRKGF